MNYKVEIECTKIDHSRAAKWLRENNCLPNQHWQYHVRRTGFDQWTYTFEFRDSGHAALFALRWS
jgi:hypothetical protein